MAFQLNPKSDLLKNTGNFNTVSSPAKLAPLIAAAVGGGGAAAAASGAAASITGGAAGAAASAGAGAASGGAASGGAAASGLDPSKIMNKAGKSKSEPAKEKSKPKFYTDDEDSYYGE